MTPDKAPDSTGTPAFIGLGGSGVIGTALAAELAARGIRYVSVSLDPDRPGPAWRNLQAELVRGAPGQVGALIDDLARDHRITGILDILGLTGGPMQALADAARRHDAPVGIVSSCMLYDHDSSGPVDETCPVLTPDRAPFPYHRTKLAVEAQWIGAGQAVTWTLLRTNHILGRGALLGCIPGHNRDPDLVRRIAAGEALRLARRGQVRLSVIHPRDLAAAAVDILSGGGAAGTAVNLAHPDPVLALDYYAEIARQLGVALPPPEGLTPDPGDFWSVTARDNVFVSGFAGLRQRRFRYDLAASVADALSVPPEDHAALGRHMRSRIAGGH